MTPVIVGMLLCLAAAAVILAVVAVPKLREGAPLLTDEGEDAVRLARRRAVAVAADAKRRAQAAAGQAAASAAAAREKAAAVRQDAASQQPAEQKLDEVDVRERELQRAARGPAARRGRVEQPVVTEPLDQPEPPDQHEPWEPTEPQVETTTESAADAVIDMRDGDPPLRRRRGSHRRLVELGWGDPVPGPRHTR